MTATSIWLRKGDDTYEVTAVSPSVWQGECECVVGPFSSRSVAERFTGLGEDFGHFNLGERVFAHRDAWYVEVTALGDT